jgi:hypothetical protein
MSARVPTGVEWRKSSFSGSENDDSLGCVEVALLPDGGVALRESRARDGQVHVYTAAEWDAFVKGVQAGEFDCP